MKSLIDFRRRLIKLDKTLKTVDYKSKKWRDAYLEHRAIEKNIGRQ